MRKSIIFFITFLVIALVSCDQNIVSHLVNRRQSNFSLSNRTASGVIWIKPKKIVINLLFNATGEFSEGLARVKTAEKLDYIEKKGKYVWESTK